ncbi:hypothetical protein Tco_1275755 [Tanacetum coccineum]
MCVSLSVPRSEPLPFILLTSYLTTRESWLTSWSSGGITELVPPLYSLVWLSRHVRRAWGPHTILLYTVIVPCLIGINATDSSGPEPSFDGPASAEYYSRFELACHKSSKSELSVIISSEGFADLCFSLHRLKRPDLDELIDKYGIPLKLHPQLPPPDAFMSELPNDIIVFTDPADDDSLLGFSNPLSGRMVSSTSTGGLFLIPCLGGMRIRLFIDPKPSPNTYDLSKAQKLRAFVVKICDIPEGVLVLSGLSRVWRNPSCDLVLRDSNGTGSKVHEEPLSHEKPILERLPFYFTPPTAIDAVIPDPTLDKLTGTEPNAKVLAKAEASTKRRSSTSARTSSQSTNIGPYVVGPSSTILDIDGDDIERDLFPHMSGAFMDPNVCRAIVDRFPTPIEVLRVETPSDDQLMDKMNVDAHQDQANASGTALAKVKEKSKGPKKKVKSLTKIVDQLTAKAACVVSDLHDAQRAESYKSGQLVEA